MARKQLFDFMHDGKRINVYTGESSSDVYFSVNGGSSRGTGIRHNESLGNFKSGSGSTLSHDEAKSRIRDQI
jgi:hypothetical protein